MKLYEGSMRSSGAGQKKNYLAIRIPQTYNSPRLKQLIMNGMLNSKELLRIELLSLEGIRNFDKGYLKLDDVLTVLKQGIVYRGEQDYTSEYEQLLNDKPWKICPCDICKEVGVEVVMLRNRERNLRRGFHNLFIFSEELRKKFPYT